MHGVRIAGRSAKDEFKDKRIACSQFFDIDGVANTASPLPHMVPSEEAFSAAASALKVGPQDTVVLYDRLGNWSSPRAWWTWKVFGHARCACKARRNSAPSPSTSLQYVPPASVVQMYTTASMLTPAWPPPCACHLLLLCTSLLLCPQFETHLRIDAQGDHLALIEGSKL